MNVYCQNQGQPVKLKVNFVFYRTNRKFQSWGKSDESKFCLSNIKFKSTVSWTWPSTAKSRTTLAFTHACTASAGLYGLDGGTFSAFNGDGNICQPFYYLSQYLNDPKKFYLCLKSFFEWSQEGLFIFEIIFYIFLTAQNWENEFLIGQKKSSTNIKFVFQFWAVEIQYIIVNSQTSSCSKIDEWD